MDIKLIFYEGKNIKRLHVSLHPPIIDAYGGTTKKILAPKGCSHFRIGSGATARDVQHLGLLFYP